MPRTESSSEYGPAVLLGRGGLADGRGSSRVVTCLRGRNLQFLCQGDPAHPAHK